MTTIEAAKLLQCSPQFIRDLIKRGLLDAVKRGRDWDVDDGSVAQRIEERLAKKA